MHWNIGWSCWRVNEPLNWFPAWGFQSPISSYSAVVNQWRRYFPYRIANVVIIAIMIIWRWERERKGGGKASFLFGKLEFDKWNYRQSEAIYTKAQSRPSCPYLILISFGNEIFIIDCSFSPYKSQMQPLNDTYLMWLNRWLFIDVFIILISVIRRRFEFLIAGVASMRIVRFLLFDFSWCALSKLSGEMSNLDFDDFISSLNYCFIIQ